MDTSVGQHVNKLATLDIASTLFQHLEGTKQGAIKLGPWFQLSLS